MVCPYCRIKLEYDATFANGAGGRIDPEEERRKEAEKLAKLQHQKYVVLNRYYQQVFQPTPMAMLYPV